LVNAAEFLICQIILNAEYLKKLIENPAQFYLTFLLLMKLNIWFFNKRVKNVEETNAFRDFERAFNGAALIFDRKSYYFYDLNSIAINDNGLKLSFIFRVNFYGKFFNNSQKILLIFLN
jgi:hypothetical protein